MIALLEVKLADNQARYGFDVVTLNHIEAEFLYGLHKLAPNTATYDALCHAIWGKRHRPAGWLRQLATTAAALRVKIAPWGFAILCHSRIGYRLIHEPMHAGAKSWRGDEELLLCKLAADGMSAQDMVAHLPRHNAKAIRGKLWRMRKAAVIRSQETHPMTEKAA
jgi:hypothetical protein